MGVRRASVATEADRKRPRDTTTILTPVPRQLTM